MNLTSYYKDARYPILRISRDALVPLLWSVSKNQNEFSFWGVLEKTEGGLRLATADLSKHESCPSYNEPDMEWYGDWLADKVADEGKQPWQLACWIHTHPVGINTPSAVDDSTFRTNFGEQRLAVMLIMTREGSFYARLSAIVEPMEGIGVKTYTSSPMRIEFEDEMPLPTQPELNALDAAFPALVSELVTRKFKRDDDEYETLADLSSHNGGEREMWRRATFLEGDDEDLPRLKTPKHFTPRSVNKLASVVDRETLVRYLAEGATIGYDNTVEYEPILLSTEIIAESLLEDGMNAPAWLVMRVAAQIKMAIIDKSLDAEVWDVICKC